MTRKLSLIVPLFLLVNAGCAPPEPLAHDAPPDTRSVPRATEEEATCSGSGSVPYAGGLTNTATRWPRGVVHWVFCNDDAQWADPSCDDDKEPYSVLQGRIIDAINHIEERIPGISFVHHPNQPSSVTTIEGVLVFERQTDTGAPPGRNEVLGFFDSPLPLDHQTIWLKANVSAWIVAHEILHALGLPHEQQRLDAYSEPPAPGSDQIAIVWQNVDDAGQFNKKGDVTLTPYDFRSIMHYGASAGCITQTNSSNCQSSVFMNPFTNTPITTSNTIITRPGTNINRQSILTEHDINGLAQLYPPRHRQGFAGDQFGASLAIGDFDADGYDDIAIGAPTKDGADISNPQSPTPIAESGRVMVFKGTDHGPIPWHDLQTRSVDPTLTPEPYDHFGASLAVGDVNNDGVEDLVVGAPGRSYQTTADTGAVFVFLGGQFSTDPLLDPNLVNTTNTSGLTGNHCGDPVAPFLKSAIINNLVVPSSPQPGDLFGQSVAVANVGGSTTNDILIGSPGRDNHGIVHAATVGCVGSTLQVTWSFSISPPEAIQGGLFGDVVAAADLDFDGPPVKSEIIVGSPGADLVWVFDESTLLNYIKNPNGAGDEFGSAIALDMTFGPTGDPTIFVGTPGRNNNEGAVEAFTWDSSLADSTHFETIDNPTGDAGRFGSALAAGSVGNVKLESLLNNQLLFAGAPAASNGAGAAIFFGIDAGQLELGCPGSCFVKIADVEEGIKSPIGAFGTAIAIRDPEFPGIPVRSLELLGEDYDVPGRVVVGAPLSSYAEEHFIGFGGSVHLYSLMLEEPTFLARAVRYLESRGWFAKNEY